MGSIMTVDEIRAALIDRRISMIVEATGLSYNTIRYLRDGVVQVPADTTIEILSRYLSGEM